MGGIKVSLTLPHPSSFITSPRLLHVPQTEAPLLPATLSGPFPTVLRGIGLRTYKSLPPAQTQLQLPTNPTSQANQQGRGRKQRRPSTHSSEAPSSMSSSPANVTHLKFREHRVIHVSVLTRCYNRASLALPTLVGNEKIDQCPCVLKPSSHPSDVLKTILVWNQ